MPYITERRKRELESRRAPLLGAGDLTYAMTLVAIRFNVAEDEDYFYKELDFVTKRYLPSEPRYENYAIVLGSIDATKREYLRRVTDGIEDTIVELLELYAQKFYAWKVAPYEDTKIEQNGDVY